MKLIKFGHLEKILEISLLNALQSCIPTNFYNLYDEIDSDLERKYLCLYQKGIEFILNFEDEINHIRFYLDTKGYQKNYSYYSSDLPFQIHNSMKKDDVHKILGIPSKSFERFENKFTTFPESDQYLKESYYIEIQYNNDFSLYSVGICIEKNPK